MSYSITLGLNMFGHRIEMNVLIYEIEFIENQPTTKVSEWKITYLSIILHFHFKDATNSLN